MNPAAAAAPPHSAIPPAAFAGFQAPRGRLGVSQIGMRVKPHAPRPSYPASLPNQGPSRPADQPARTRHRSGPYCASGRGGGSGSWPGPLFAGSPRHLRRGRRQRRPAGDGPDAGPRILVVGDSGEPTAQLDRCRQFTVLLIDGADCGCIGFGDDEHDGKDGRRHGVGQGERRQAKGDTDNGSASRDAALRRIRRKRLRSAGRQR